MKKADRGLGLPAGDRFVRDPSAAVIFVFSSLYLCRTAGIFDSTKEKSNEIKQGKEYYLKNTLRASAMSCHRIK